MARISKNFTFALLLSIALFPAMLRAQGLTQTIRGKITDQDSRMPLPGVNVVILRSDVFLGASTDEQGNFRIENVPIGRTNLKISYIGYEEKILSHLLLTSGKETVLEVALQESLIGMDEVVIHAGQQKSDIANEMALVSARGFTVEETKRYAGSFNDPGRMASGYAGVTGDASGDNEIIVRGNSPKGIQWRLEGIEIPNPNHFSDEGATGGPINALNSIMLADSEFYTGAFAPEFGNALSGVFDMRLRKGNNQQKEYSASIGILGTEATLEGPFTRGGGSSYLVNYRYSTLTMLNDLGLVNFGGIPKYQDVSFKVHLPTAGFGTFSLFGLGGKSSIVEEEFSEENEEDLLRKGNYKADMGVIGLTQYWPLGSKTFLQNSISLSQNGSGFKGYEPNELDVLETLYDSKLNKNTIKGASTLNHKFNARHNLQTGIIYTQHYFNFYNKYFDKGTEEFVTDQDMEGDAGHLQGFVSWKFRPSEKLSIVSGLHVHGTTLNRTLNIEPRASMRWQIHPSQAITAGFGIHGKMESLTNYFSIIPNENGADATPNENLGFSKAAHYVAGYENQLGANLSFKAEAYYQRLYQVPIENKAGSSYSLINQADWFTDRILVNQGTGRNLGLELTLERYFHDSYYFMVTASLYDSKYKAMDGIARNTMFNGNYAGNVLFGKEFQLNTGSEKKRIIGINSKISLLGARRFTPINHGESVAKDKVVWDEERAFSGRGDDVFFINLALTYRIDRKRTSQELKLDVQNLTNHSAKIAPYYNDMTGEVEYLNQLSLLPVLMYTVHF
ncbi:MAG TPA: TonB-dependent receptor [Cyclobacteriaceae bacterium]|nr:TonB-dependent receptor [Cyclobacteriaceae bacterium]